MRLLPHRGTHLNAVATAYEDQGVAVLGVNAKDDLGTAHSFATSAALTYPSWFDPEQQIAAQFGSGGPVGLPTTVILDDEHPRRSPLLRLRPRFHPQPAIDAVLAETASH